MARPAAQRADEVAAPAASEPVSFRSLAIFAVVSLALLMASIDVTIVAVGIPTMVESLNTNLVWIGWVMTAYALAQTVAMPLAGKLSDTLGRKRLFLGCVLLFTVSSICSALAPNVYLLILFRVFQALGGGAFLPSAAGIVSDVFGPKHRGTALGLFTSVFPVGGIIGPNVGGIVIESLGWRGIFAVNVPIGVTLFTVGLFLLPSGTRRGSPRSIDLIGIAAFVTGITSLLVGLSTWGSAAAFGFKSAAWFAAGAIALVFFVRHQGRTSDPLVDIRLLRDRAFAAANLYNFLYGALVFGFFSFVPLYATLEYDMTARAAGFVLTPRALGMIGLSAVSSFLLARTGYRLPMISGILIISGGLFFVGQSWHNPAIFGHTISNILLLSVLMALTGIGVGIGGPAANNAAIDLMPDAVAQITGLRGMFRSTGGMLGIASIVVALSHYPNEAQGLEDVFVALSFLILLAIPPIFLIPDRGQHSQAAPTT